MKTLKKPVRSYKIAEVEKETERFVVNAEFYEGKKKVGEIKHAFSLELSEKEIEGEVAKACKTFFEDGDRAVKNKEKDELDKAAQGKIDKLNGKEKNI
jgi:hypothetical protein